MNWLVKYLPSLILCLFLLRSNANAQSNWPTNCPYTEELDIHYFKAYGAPFGEQGNAVQCLEGGFVVTGMQLSNPKGGGQVYPGLLLTDAHGHKVFCKKYESLPQPTAVQHVQANTQGFLIAANNWLMQADSMGTPIWTKILDPIPSSQIQAIMPRDEGGYIIAATTWPEGSVYSEVLMAHMNSNGEFLWSRIYDSPNTNIQNLHITTTGDGYSLSGRGRIGSFNGVFLIHTDGAGELRWSRYIDSTYDDELVAILPDGQDGQYLLGRSYSLDSEWDPFLVQVNSEGSLIAQRFWQGILSDEQARAATLLHDSVLTIAFDSGNSNSRSPALLSIQLPSLEINWCKRYPYEEQFTNYVLDVCPTENGGFLMVGDMHLIGHIRDSYLIRTNPLGEAGCHSQDYPMHMVDRSMSVNEHSVQVLDGKISSLDFSASSAEAHEVIEFSACEHLPPCPYFEIEDETQSQCDQHCFEFENLSSLDPVAWEWTFEGGTPHVYNGELPPPICWETDGNHTVQLLVRSKSGIEEVFIDSLGVSTNCPPEFPNVFSPNWDGVNDLFAIEHLPEQFQLSIYNRWGLLIFSSQSKTQQWDGRVQSSGEEVSEGVYFYELIDKGRTLRYAGYIQLLR